MNSTKLKRKLAQKTSRAFALRNDSKLKKYNTNKKSYFHEKNEPSSAKIINEVIQIKRRRMKYTKSSAFGDTDSIKSSNSQESVIYVDTKYPKLNFLSMIDLTKSDSDLTHTAKRKQRKPRKEMNNKQITTIQSANNLACRSSEDIGLIVKNYNESDANSTKNTQSGIQLKRTQPRTSMSENENVKNGDGEDDEDDENFNALVPLESNHFLNEVSDMIHRDLSRMNEIEKMVYEMDIDTMVELYNVNNSSDRFDEFDL